jgi:hypothetical protein
MTWPPVLPDWLPWWAALLLALPVALYILALLLMPFAVLGTKGRLDAIDLRLDELHGEIRGLALRLREPAAATAHYDEAYVSPPQGQRAASAEQISRHPPIPPPMPGLHEAPRRARAEVPAAAPAGHSAGRARAERSGRAEPRLDWPR